MHEHGYHAVGYVDINPGQDFGAHHADSFERAAHKAKEYDAFAFTWVPSQNTVYLKGGQLNVIPTWGGLLCVSGFHENEYNQHRHHHHDW